MVEKTRVLSFFGPPGTGKGTIAQRCVRELGYVMLSTGDLARKHIHDKTELGKLLASYVNSGHLIPDDLITQMVLDWLKPEIMPGQTIILDGFPRTKGQAEFLLSALVEDPDLSEVVFKVINFELPFEEIVKRLSNRMVCSNKECQHIYSLSVKQPVKEGVCDLCGSSLIRRPDDAESVVRERLVVFSKFKDDLLGFYKSSGRTPINFVIPVGGPDKVFDAFIKFLSH